MTAHAIIVVILDHANIGFVEGIQPALLASQLDNRPLRH